VDYNRVVLIQERLVERQQTLAEAQGQIALGLIQVYRALGGGWQIRCERTAVSAAPGPVRGQAPSPVEGTLTFGPVTDPPAGWSDAAEEAYSHSGLRPQGRRR
jgi:hypothetical protein